MAVLDDLKTYLGPDVTQWDDAELESAITAETAAQARVIKHIIDGSGQAIAPADWPAQGYGDLYEALLRRCARNLAMRKIPLGLAVFNGGVESTRVGRDPEIRRLEAPWRRMSLG